MLARYGPRLPGIVENALIRQSMPAVTQPSGGRFVPFLWALGGAGAGAAVTLAAIWIG